MRWTRLQPALSWLPWGLLAMIALVWAVETFVSHRSLDYLDMTSVTWRMSGRAARRESPKCHILCVGDSMAKFGFVTRVIEHATGKRAYNLAVNAAHPPVDYFLFRRALEAGARPSALVMDVSPIVSGTPPRLLEREMWAELLSPRECLDLAWTAKDADFFAATMLARFLPSVRYRNPIRTEALAAFRGETASSRASVLAYRRNLSRNRGALIKPHVPVARANFDDPHWPLIGIFFPPMAWTCNEVNKVYIYRTLELAEARRIPVFGLIPPINSEIMDRRERLGQEAMFSRFIAGLLSRFPTLTVVDGRKSRYDASVYWDALIHLDARGAFILSADLAAVLNRQGAGVAGSRWVHLPAFRDQPVDIPLEDTAQSAVALNPPPGSVRR